MGWFSNREIGTINKSEKNDPLLKKIDTLKSQVDFYKDEIANSSYWKKGTEFKEKYDFIERCEKIKKENIELEKDIIDLKKEHNKELAKIGEKNKGLRSDIAELKKELETANTKIKDTTEELNVYCMRYEQLASANDPKQKLLTEAKMLRKKVKDLNEKLKTKLSKKKAKEDEVDLVDDPF